MTREGVNSGKSIFAESLEYQGLTFEMPMLRQMEDLIEFAHSYPPKRAYLIDMPRGITKDKMGEFYGGVECLKNGVTYDKRYHGKKRQMSRPHIFTFTGVLADFSLISMDRCIVWDMKADTSMVERIAGHTGSGISFLIAESIVLKYTAGSFSMA